MNLEHNMQWISLPAGNLLASHEGVNEVVCGENIPEVILFCTCVSVLILNDKHLSASCLHFLTLKFSAGKRVRFWTACTTNSCMAHCHHCIAHPVVADRGDNFRVRRVAASILDNLAQTADGRLSSLGFGRGLVTLLHMWQHVLKC